MNEAYAEQDAAPNQLESFNSREAEQLGITNLTQRNARRSHLYERHACPIKALCTPSAAVAQMNNRMNLVAGVPFAGKRRIDEALIFGRERSISYLPRPTGSTRPPNWPSDSALHKNL
jgi:hypothetical protein